MISVFPNFSPRIARGQWLQTFVFWSLNAFRSS